MRLKPICRSAPAAAGVAVRGSTSIEISHRARCLKSRAARPSGIRARRRTGRWACRRRSAAATPAARVAQRQATCSAISCASASRYSAALVVLGDDLVAGAVVAHRFAERDVHVQRQRRRRPPWRRRHAVASACGTRRPEGLDEAVGRGVRGVAGPGTSRRRSRLFGISHGRSESAGSWAWAWTVPNCARTTDLICSIQGRGEPNRINHNSDRLDPTVFAWPAILTGFQDAKLPTSP
jgi:hypothetical protein